MRKSSKTICLLAALIFSAFAAGSTFGQETRGTIRGTVTDPNGQPVPNATVHVTDPARGSDDRSDDQRRRILPGHISYSQ